MIRAALAATRWRWPEIPTIADPVLEHVAMVTFVDPGKVARKRDPGRCFLRAGFRRIGETAGGLVALGIHPEALPAPAPPTGAQPGLFD